MTRTPKEWWAYCDSKEWLSSNHDDARTVVYLAVQDIQELSEQLAESRKLLDEVWNSVPGTFDKSQEVQRHAKALNKIGRFLSRSRTEAKP